MKFVKDLKIENWFGWKTDENFDSGIVKTIEWYFGKYNKEINFNNKKILNLIEKKSILKLKVKLIQYQMKNVLT